MIGGGPASPAGAADRTQPPAGGPILNDPRRWLAYCERLLRPLGLRQICQSIADEIACTNACDWSAVLHIDGHALGFDVAGSVGNVPAALHEWHGRTPMELATALGWDAGGAIAQKFVPRESSRLHQLVLGEWTTAFVILSENGNPRGVALAGRAPSLPFTGLDLAMMERVCVVGAAALRHAGRIADLRMSDQSKSEFVATMSHELRNPLSAILGYTDLFVHGEFGSVTDEQLEILRRAHHNARFLLDLINATLDVSRFEVGDRIDQTERLDLLSIVGEQIGAITSRGEGRRIRSPTSDRGPLFLATDRSKLAVALRQLLEAALATNRMGELCVNARSTNGGCAIEISPAGMAPSGRGTPVLIDWPPQVAMPGPPFAIFVAKRLLEILGGNLSVWRDDGGEAVIIHMWVPDREE